MIFRIAVLSLSLSAVCSIVHAAEVTDVVRCAEIAFSRSVETGDAEQFRELIDPDARFVGSSGSVRHGPSEVFAAWSGFFEEDGPRIIWRPEIVEVLDDGGLALSRGPYIFTTNNDDGSTSTSWGMFNSVWRLNNDGIWRVVFDAGGPQEGKPPESVHELIQQPVTDCEEH